MVRYGSRKRGRLAAERRGGGAKAHDKGMQSGGTNARRDMQQGTQAREIRVQTGRAHLEMRGVTDTYPDVDAQKRDQALLAIVASSRSAQGGGCQGRSMTRKQRDGAASGHSYYVYPNHTAAYPLALPPHVSISLRARRRLSPRC